MAASFKIPTSLKRKAKQYPELPKFEWKLCFGPYTYENTKENLARKSGYQKE
jgi:hypothetical protein